MPTLEFLCVKRNHRRQGAQTDDQTHRRGDVVAIKESPATWARYEDPDQDGDLGGFVVLTVTGAPEIDHLVHRGFLQGLDEIVDGEPRMRVRKEKTLRFQDLPTPKRIELNTTGKTTINLAIFNDIVTVRQ